MTNEKNKRDLFTEAMEGTVPIKKANKNYKPIPQIKLNQKILDKKIIETNSDYQKKTNKDEKKDSYKYLKIEKSNINKKLKKGLINIDVKIDFHGLSLEDAKSKFFETINRCFMTKKRCILFITGKGMNKNQNSEERNKLFYGKIRNEFIKWTNEKEPVQKILNIEQAGISYGGDGAFFVYLRKNKN